MLLTYANVTTADLNNDFPLPNSAKIISCTNGARFLNPKIKIQFIFIFGLGGTRALVEVSFRLSPMFYYSPYDSSLIMKTICL